MEQRKILHVDMDAFYASVEQRDDPSLRGKPLVVGGSNNRGVVAAASYEARKFGIRSAMPMRDAYRRCPDLLRVRPQMSHYQAVSKEIFTIFREFTPIVEGLSLDEAFLDVTACLSLFGDEVGIAQEVKNRIKAQTALTASVGVAPNKLVAKIASDLDKPDGLTVVMPENMRDVLDPLPARVIPGIGRETLLDAESVGQRNHHDLFHRRHGLAHHLLNLDQRIRRAVRAEVGGLSTELAVFGTRPAFGVRESAHLNLGTREADAYLVGNRCQIWDVFGRCIEQGLGFGLSKGLPIQNGLPNG